MLGEGRAKERLIVLILWPDKRVLNIRHQRRHLIMKNPLCGTCQVEMDKGFMPDHYAKTIQSVWHPGNATEKTLFGDLKLNTAALIPVTVFRCPQCGHLSSFAVKTD